MLQSHKVDCFASKPQIQQVYDLWMCMFFGLLCFLLGFGGRIDWVKHAACQHRRTRCTHRSPQAYSSISVPFPHITYSFYLYKMSHFHLTQLSNPLFTISLPPVGLEIIPICLRRELVTWLRYDIRRGVLFMWESGNTFCVKFEVLSSGTKALVSCVQLENWIGSWWFHWHIESVTDEDGRFERKSEN